MSYASTFELSTTAGGEWVNFTVNVKKTFLFYTWPPTWSTKQVSLPPPPSQTGQGL